jgi:NADH-quinone oxidoreductase E subunit
MAKRSPTDNWPEIERRSKAALPPHIVEFLGKVRNEPNGESQLIHALHKVQAHFGYLGPTQMDAVAYLLGVPTAQVSGVATFYHFFRLQPRGKFIINVCMGTACYVRGAQKLLDKLKGELGIDLGQTTSDGMFTLEQTRCVGTCGLAPVMMINETVHAKVTPEQLPNLLAQCRESLSTET